MHKNFPLPPSSKFITVTRLHKVPRYLFPKFSTFPLCNSSCHGPNASSAASATSPQKSLVRLKSSPQEGEKLFPRFQRMPPTGSRVSFSRRELLMGQNCCAREKKRWQGEHRGGRGSGGTLHSSQPGTGMWPIVDYAPPLCSAPREICRFPSLRRMRRRLCPRHTWWTYSSAGHAMLSGLYREISTSAVHDDFVHWHYSSARGKIIEGTFIAVAFFWVIAVDLVWYWDLVFIWEQRYWEQF